MLLNCPALVLGIIFSVFAPNDRKSNGNPLDTAIVEVLKSVNSDEVRQILNAATKDLWSKDVFARRSAVYVFADVRAKQVIVELLTDDVHRETIRGYGLHRILGIESIPRLYQITDEWDRRPITNSSNAAGPAVAEAELRAHIATVLKIVEPDYANGTTTLWEPLLKLAKEKRSLDKALDELVETVRESR